MNVQLLILVIYVVALAGVSLFANHLRKKMKKGVTGYLLAGRQLPAIMVATMLAGLAIGGVSTVGVAQNAYTSGISAGWYNAAWGAAGILVGIFAARYLRSIQVVTIPEMMGKMFGRKAHIIGAFAQLLIMMVITSLQYVAGGAILAALLPEIFTFHTGMIATATLFVGIALTGGYLAGGLASIINVIVIYFGIGAALVSSLKSVGGVTALVESLPAGPWFDPISGVGLAVVTAWMVVMITQGFSLQAITQIAFAAKDESTARKGFIIGGIIILPAGFLCAVFGVIAALQFPGLENSAMALPRLLTTITPAIGGVFLAALWAADISTAVGLLLGSTTLVMQDIFAKVWTEGLSPRKEVFLSRISVLVVSALTFFLALTAVSILKMVTTALAITVSFTILILANIFLPGLSKRISGFWTILASILVWLVWTLLPETRIVPHVIYLEWPICLAVFLLTVVLGKEPAGSIVSNTEVLENNEFGDTLVEEA